MLQRKTELLLIPPKYDFSLSFCLVASMLTALQALETWCDLSCFVMIKALFYDVAWCLMPFFLSTNW